MRPIFGVPPSSSVRSSESLQAERDALENRAGERAAVVAEAEADERAARVGVGVGGPLAGEVGQEDQALGAGGPVLGLFEEGAECRRPGRWRCGAR